MRQPSTQLDERIEVSETLKVLVMAKNTEASCSTGVDSRGQHGEHDHYGAGHAESDPGDGRPFPKTAPPPRQRDPVRKRVKHSRLQCGRCASVRQRAQRLTQARLHFPIEALVLVDLMSHEAPPIPRNRSIGASAARPRRMSVLTLASEMSSLAAMSS